MWSFLGRGAPPQPPTVASDTVIPLFDDDDSKIFRSMVLCCMLRFDDVLDPEKLRASLAKLLERRDWRKPGARIRLNSKGKLDYHVPDRFDESRPPFAYSHETFQTKISEHPLAARLPSGFSGESPAVVVDPNEFLPLMATPDGPRKLSDYLYTDEPQLGLHIVSFADATLVTVRWPHVSADAMGLAELFRAWEAVLAGREGDVLPLHGFDSDPLAGFGAVAAEPYRLAERQLSMWQLVVFGVRQALESLWYPGEDARILCVPGAYVASLRAAALGELAGAAAAGAPAFVSEGDVLAAWLMGLLAEHAPLDPRQTVALLLAIDRRPSLAADYLPAATAYFHNAASAAFTLLPAGDLRGRPLGRAAAAVRTSLDELRTRGQLEAFAKVNRDVLHRTGFPPLYGDAWMQLVIVSNWSKARFFEVDFSPAVVGSAGASRRPGRPSYSQSCCHSDGFSTRNAFQIAGKDGDGNYWLTATLRRGVWARIEEALAAAGAEAQAKQ